MKLFLLLIFILPLNLFADMPNKGPFYYCESASELGILQPTTYEYLNICEKYCDDDCGYDPTGDFVPQTKKRNFFGFVVEDAEKKEAWLIHQRAMWEEQQTAKNNKKSIRDARRNRLNSAKPLNIMTDQEKDDYFDDLKKYNKGE